MKCTCIALSPNSTLQIASFAKPASLESLLAAAKLRSSGPCLSTRTRREAASKAGGGGGGSTGRGEGREEEDVAGTRRTRKRIDDDDDEGETGNPAPPQNLSTVTEASFAAEDKPDTMPPPALT